MNDSHDTPSAPTPDNVISLRAAREVRDAQSDDLAYQAQILGMDKLELLEEMVRFQEERSRLGHLTVKMMIRGRHLFRALEDSAETQELKLLTRSYRRHLEYELKAFQTNGSAAGSLS